MKKLLVIILLVAIVAIIWWAMSGKQAVAPTADTTGAPQNVATTGVEADLQGLSETDLNAEFQTIDQDAQSL